MTKLLYIFLIPWSLFAYASQAQAYANFPHDSTLEVFSEKGKKGIRNESGNILLNAKYQAFGWSEGKLKNNVDVIGYKQNDFWGLMSKDFKKITKPKYNSLIPFNEELFIISEKSKYSKVLFYGVVKANGKAKIKTKYRNIIPAGDFLITATKKEQSIYFGIINSGDKAIVPFQYYYIYFLGHNNFLLTQENSKKELVKLTPKPQTLFEDMDSVSTFRDGVAIIFKNGKQGLIRQDGKILLPIEYKKIEWNNGKHIYVTPLDEWKVFNIKGRELREHKADSIFYLNDSLLVKNTSSFAQIRNIRTEQDQQVFRADIKDLFGENYILENLHQTFIAQDSNKVITEKFAGSVQWNENFFVAQKKTYKGSSYVIINSKGKSVVADSFRISDDLIELKIKSYWGIFNQNLSEIIPPLYNTIQRNAEHFIVNFKGQMGVVNQKNDWIIPPQYVSIKPISNHNYKLVDKYLREFISDETARVEASLYYDFYDEYVVEQNASSHYRLIDMQGIPITAFQPGKYSGHGHSGILFKNDNKHILLDQEGIELFTIQDYDTIIISHDEYLTIKKNGNWGFINRDGLLRVANRYDAVRPFSNELSAVKIRNAWGFINRQEELVVQPYYSEVSDFENNTAFVKMNNKFGLIDVEGNFIIEAEYDEIIKENEFYLLRKASKWGIAKNDGTLISYPTYNKITVADSFLKVEKYGSIRILTKQGNDLINQQFDNIYFDNQRKVFLAKKNATREQVFLTDILSGKYP